MRAGGRSSRSLMRGIEPEVIRTYGCFGTDRLFKGRQEVNRLTGNYKVPTLVLDDGTIIDGSQNIVAWARADPARPSAADSG